ncbi:general odorant-binding protein 28a-like [Pectinophora gossypiella]|uniref:general odorant-binding protein 28a-like n=1 Tax=Pectinophora gossypiella TaxID=13191 RepID=UPI00214E6E9E|nr:general odorant-binding protein 28a-like [Pectinophora gossypiella]
MFNFFIIFAAISYVIIYIRADPIEDLKVKYVNYILDCSKTYEVSPEDIEMLKSKQMPDRRSVKCAFACAYKKAGIMNEDGELSVPNIFVLSKQYLSDDPVKLQKAMRFAEACKSVNDVDLSEDDEEERECERAALIFKCSVDKAPQFDFIV